MNTIERLIFSGGGIRGIAFLGALMGLRDVLDKEPCQMGLKQVVGCSVGSLVALLIVLGYTIDEMENYLGSLDLSELSTVTMESVLTQFAMNDGRTLWKMTQEALKGKNKSLDLTLADVPTLYVVVTDITKAKCRILSAETDPAMSVSKAVAASMSLPPMFAPIKHQGSLLCDGGLMNNFPINDFPSEGTLAFRTAWYVDPTPPDNLLTYYNRILACLQVPMELSYQKSDQDKIMTIDVGPMATLRFNIDKGIPEQVSALVLQGYRQSHAFFAKKRHILFKDPLSYL